MNAITQDLANAGIRKAAILVACLDRAAADAVLEQLSPEQAQRVRQAVVVLDEIPDKEQRHVVDEFFRLGPQKSAQQSSGVELGGRLAREIGMKHSALHAKQAISATSGRTSKPLCVCGKPKTKNSSRLLAGERPQTIALVLSHLIGPSGRRRIGAPATKSPDRGGPAAGRSGGNRSGHFAGSGTSIGEQTVATSAHATPARGRFGCDQRNFRGLGKRCPAANPR